MISSRVEGFDLEPWPPAKYYHGDPTQYMRSADELSRGDLVILCARCSSREQARKDNLSCQKASLRQEAERRGLVVVATFTEVWPGNDPGSWLARAAEEAKRQRAVLLAESVDRLVRSESFDPKAGPSDCYARPSWDDLERLKSATKDVRLFTIVSPSATPTEIRVYQTKRGQKGKGKKGGRPRTRCPGWKRRLREDRRPEAIRLHDEGESLGVIAKALGIPRSTIQRWVREIDGGGERFQTTFRSVGHGGSN